MRVREVEELLVRQPCGPIAIRFGASVGTRELPEDLILREVRELDFSTAAFSNGVALPSVVDFMRCYGVIDTVERWDWGLFDFGTRIGRKNFADASRTNGVLTEECATLLQLARCLADHWVYHKDGHSSLDAWHHWPFQPAIKDEELAWDGFTHYLNLGLRALAPGVIYQPVGDEPPDASSGKSGEDINLDEWRGTEPNDLFDALCVQLYSIVVNDNAVLTCANEACRKRFTVQRGRAKAKQYRSVGVVYCSTSCASTQLSRERRRRMRTRPA